MRRGGVRWIVVPPHLAYGSAGDSEGIVPGDAVLIFELVCTWPFPSDHLPRTRAALAFGLMGADMCVLRQTLVDVVAAESGNGDEGPVPMVPLEGDRAVLSAIKSLRPPSETSEDANEWEEEGEGLAETPVVLVPSGNEGDGADNHGVEKGEEDQQGEEGGTEGDSAQVNGEEGSADDQDEMLKSRMAKLSEHGGPGLHGPGLHMLIGGRAAHGAQYAGHAGRARASFAGAACVRTVSRWGHSLAGPRCLMPCEALAESRQMCGHGWRRWRGSWTHCEGGLIFSWMSSGARQRGVVGPQIFSWGRFWSRASASSSQTTSVCGPMRTPCANLSRRHVLWRSGQATSDAS